MNVLQNPRLPKTVLLLHQKRNFQHRNFYEILRNMSEIFFNEVSLTRIMNSLLLNYHNNSRGLYQGCPSQEKLFQGNSFQSFSTKTYVVHGGPLLQQLKIKKNKLKLTKIAIVITICDGEQYVSHIISLTLPQIVTDVQIRKQSSDSLQQKQPPDRLDKILTKYLNDTDFNGFNILYRFYSCYL